MGEVIYMRIAICFSGQPRFINECAAAIKKNVIPTGPSIQHAIDIFAHLWFSHDSCNDPYKYGGSGGWKNQRINPTAIQSFVDQYCPTKLKYESPSRFVDQDIEFDGSLARYWRGGINNPEEPDFRNRTVNNCLSYFYSLSEVNRMRKLHEHQNGIHYDYVVRCRTDVILTAPVQYAQYDKNKLHYSTINAQPDGMVCDWFNFGGREAMDAFMSPYANIDSLIKKCIKENGAWCPELIHRKSLDCFGIEPEGHVIHMSLPRF